MRLQYNTTRDHLCDELMRADLLLQRELLKQKKYAQTMLDNDSLNGSESMKTLLENFIAGNSAQGNWFNSYDTIISQDTEYTLLSDAIALIDKTIHEKTEKSISNNIELRLTRLCKLFGLDETEKIIICMCLLPHLYIKYEKHYIFIYDDPTRKYPCADLIMQMLSDGFGESLFGKDYFSGESSLIFNRILEYIDDPSEKNRPVGRKQLKVSQRIVDYILEREGIDSDITEVTEFALPSERISILIPGDVKESINNILNNFDRSIINSDGFLFYFNGPYGSGKKEAALDLCGTLGLPVLIINLKLCLNQKKSFDKILRLVFRESRIKETAIYFRNADYIFNNNSINDYERNFFIKIINQNRNLFFIGSREDIDFHEWFSGKRFFEIGFYPQDFNKRKEIWNYFLVEKGLKSAEPDIERVAAAYNLTGGKIRDAVDDATCLSMLHSQKSNQISLHDLIEACRTQSTSNLKNLARKIESYYTWEDLVLPREELMKLHEIADRLRYGHIVFDEWEHGKKHSLGKGINSLFYGLSGTGKTMAAGIIAKELGLDLYTIDLSAVVSKYIGETEKNLHNIFKEAETSNAVLFFDEADALFGKRSEVKDAHDRYANIEVGYLLQKMEEYQGITVLATNYYENMDEAFTRRMQFKVQFPFPDAIQRKTIWQGIFTDKTPLDDSVDFDFISHQFAITGGNIKNMALTAAFYAASDGMTVTMKHLILAAKREYHKIGRMCTKNEFGEYYDIVNS